MRKKEVSLRLARLMATSSLMAFGVAAAPFTVNTGEDSFVSVSVPTAYADEDGEDHDGGEDHDSGEGGDDDGGDDHDETPEASESGGESGEDGEAGEAGDDLDEDEDEGGDAVLLNDPSFK